MRTFDYKNITSKKLERLLKRPAFKSDSVVKIAKPILQDIKNNGDKAVLKYSKKFDGLKNWKIKISKSGLNRSAKKLSKDVWF